MMRVIYLIVIFLLLATAVHADLSNAKTIETIRVRMVQSGTLRVAEPSLKANVSYYVPLEGIVNIDVTGTGDMTWKYINDTFGNKLVLMEWKKPEHDVHYNIEMVIENNALHTLKDKQVGSDPNYLKQTAHVVIDDKIRELSFPFERSMKRATEITQFVFDYIDYDLSYLGKNVPSDQVVLEKKGVCVEHTNLAAAMMRANGIPTRYVVGYAYSAVQDRLIGHTWLEVLATDGTWIPFDPTWLQAGYLDATHIKSAVFLDNGQIDTLTYIGGNIEWIRNEEQFDVLDYTENNVTSIAATGVEQVASGSYGYIEAKVSTGECTIAMIKAVSCVDDSLTEQLEMMDQTRNFWLCEPQTIYWFFKAKGNNYICPVVVYDQTGSRSRYDITVKGNYRKEDLYITAPDTVLKNQEFALSASMPGLFYSPKFGVSRNRTWTLAIPEPGNYDFYLYLEGNIYKKTIVVIEKKEFELTMNSPLKVNLSDTFNVSVLFRNLIKSQTVTLDVQYTNHTIRQKIYMDRLEEKELNFTLEANHEGLNELIVTVAGETLTSETAIIDTPAKPDVSNIFDSIAEAFSKFLESLSLLFS